ncbi:dihydrofolate reductase [Limoniibacter endophyticus]|uniref:Dihydrofolate reductase n=1 Tax=Limoniibacter endophyticus TaxID=1565040 RepID=A0A8J3DK18_9HYPH|nr:dihydrofolate reductase [Limoniibacter endophyticus]GHC75358.1 dihydrofolate reductase [Limoniibacter endophyticus]
MIITIHVAAARNGVIGKNGTMPWHQSSDLKRFKAETFGKPVIMGRRTYESIGRALPGRLNIVVSRKPDFAAEGVEHATSLEAALDKARATGAQQACVIGGAALYAEAMDIADRLHVTHLEAEIADGDTFLKAIDPTVWKVIEEHRVDPDEKDDYPMRFTVYARK